MEFLCCSIEVTRHYCVIIFKAKNVLIYVFTNEVISIFLAIPKSNSIPVIFPTENQFHIQF